MENTADNIEIRPDGIKVITITELKQLPGIDLRFYESNVEQAITIYRLKHNGLDPKEVWILEQQAPFKPIYYTRA